MSLYACREEIKQRENKKSNLSAGVLWKVSKRTSCNLAILKRTFGKSMRSEETGKYHSHTARTCTRTNMEMHVIFQFLSKKSVIRTILRQSISLFLFLSFFFFFRYTRASGTFSLPRMDKLVGTKLVDRRPSVSFRSRVSILLDTRYLPMLRNSSFHLL